MIAKYVTTLVFTLSTALFAENSPIKMSDNQTLGMAEITNVTDGYFGAKRLYYTLKCNEIFTSTLTESRSDRTLAVGVLKEIQSRNCNQPPRQEWRRITPEGRSIIPTTSFDEVWQCRGICFIISDPEMNPYRHVVTYGTSEEQTRQHLPCPPSDQVEMTCKKIDISSNGN
jgi:hypothetical protein